MNQVPGTARSRLPWVLLALVVAVIAGVTLYRQFHSVPAQADALAPSPDPGAGGTAIGSLSPDQMRALARRSPGQSGPMNATDMAAMVEKRKRMAEATQTRNRERNAAMASRFVAEKADPAWSGAHERELASLQDSGPMRDAGAKATNFRVECRSTICHIHAEFPSQGMANDWLQLYMGNVGDGLPVATAHQARNPDGSIRVEIYGVGRKQ